MKQTLIITAAITGITTSAFAQSQRSETALPPSTSAPNAAPAIPPQNPLDLMERNNGSLLRATLQARAAYTPPGRAVSSVSFYFVPEPEAKTVKKHDLITIIIREESEISSDGTTDLKKDTDFDAHVDEFVKLSPKNFGLKGGAQGANPPSIKFGGSRNFKGEGKSDRTDSFITRIKAEVVDVKPNGTVAIQARKRIKHDEEEQEYILTGICAVSEITPDNAIYSYQVADLNVQTAHKGAVSDTTKRGWVPKLLDFANPF